ncbi:MAG: Rpn family recombination-promoting nuclease/putative transposase, partial [Alcaligenaceae bacterium]|nr:Rpn family recombination-promoting nuclease/putative transposase [Alcaligenaceae bacterium]
MIPSAGLPADVVLPPILPIVLYNGPRRWNAPLGLSALIPEPPGVVALYRPALDYLLIDLAHYNPDKLRGVRNLVALIAQMEQV